MSTTTETHSGPPPGSSLPAGARDPATREPVEIMRSLLDETQLLLRKHLELAKLELIEAVEARIRGLAAFAVAGVVGLFALGFLASALAFGLQPAMPPWLARLVVAGLFLLVALGAALYGMRRLQQPPMAPEATIRTLKEDREWARTQLQR